MTCNLYWKEHHQFRIKNELCYLIFMSTELCITFITRNNGYLNTTKSRKPTSQNEIWIRSRRNSSSSSGGGGRRRNRRYYILGLARICLKLTSLTGLAATTNGQHRHNGPDWRRESWGWFPKEPETTTLWKHRFLDIFFLILNSY